MTNNYYNENLPKVIMKPDQSCNVMEKKNDDYDYLDISSDQFVLQNTTNCCIKDPFSDPNNSRYKVFGRYANYSKYECRNEPDNTYRFLIQGERNPVPCEISQPFIMKNKHDTIDYLSTCNNRKYLGYNRNGRYFESIYHE